MYTKILKDLVKVANELDAAGFHREAAEIDDMMDPVASAAALEKTIQEERAARPAFGSDDLPQQAPKQPDAVKAKQAEMTAKFKLKVVVTGEGADKMSALNAARKELQKAAPGQKEKRADFLSAGGKVFAVIGL